MCYFVQDLHVYKIVFMSEAAKNHVPADFKRLHFIREACIALTLLLENAYRPQIIQKRYEKGCCVQHNVIQWKSLSVNRCNVMEPSVIFVFFFLPIIKRKQNKNVFLKNE